MGLHLDEISGLNKRAYRFMTRKLQNRRYGCTVGIGEFEGHCRSSVSKFEIFDASISAIANRKKIGLLTLLVSQTY